MYVKCIIYIRDLCPKKSNLVYKLISILLAIESDYLKDGVLYISYSAKSRRTIISRKSKIDKKSIFIENESLSKITDFHALSKEILKIIYLEEF